MTRSRSRSSSAAPRQRKERGVPRYLSLPTMPSAPANPRMSVIGGILPMTSGIAAATSSSDNSARMSASSNAPVTSAGMSAFSNAPGGEGVGDGCWHRDPSESTDHQLPSAKTQFSLIESNNNSPSEYMPKMLSPWVPCTVTSRILNSSWSDSARSPDSLNDDISIATTSENSASEHADLLPGLKNCTIRPNLGRSGPWPGTPPASEPGFGRVGTRVTSACDCD